MPTLTGKDLSVDTLASKSYLNVDQRQQLQQSIEHAEAMLHDPETRAQGVAPDVELLEKQLAKERLMLASGTPPELDHLSKSRLYSRVKALEEEFSSSIPTYEQMNRARPDDIDWHVAWEKRFQKHVRAWQTGLIMLDPDNTEPNFRAVSRLRGNDAQRTDPRKYFQGFDAINFQKDIEEDLIESLDDVAYLRFLELKAQGWVKVTICKKLEWSEAVYNAAEERLRRAREVGGQPEPVEEKPVVKRQRGERERGGVYPPTENPFIIAIKELGMSVGEFARIAGVQPATLYKKPMAKTTQERYDRTLKRLVAERAGAQPTNGGQPEPQFMLTSPVKE